ncbi:DUF6482 family protein [Pseudoalteromonas sp. T1lg65]|uniref:DUF6482 family protein n=1 Tax=Pseudoalteromonas sp. T1lg65 TaxID=2077101 RepID=UPI003F7A7376
MFIEFNALASYQPLQKVVVHSIDLALFQVSVVIDGTEYHVKEGDKALLQAQSPLQIQQRFAHLSYRQMVLRHQSAYDEMIGQPVRTTPNTLEVPFGQNNLF